MATMVTAAAVAASPHVHSAATVEIAVDEATHRVTADLSMPLDTMLGYERAPRTEVERSRARNAVAQLRARGLFSFDADAACSRHTVMLESDVLGPALLGESASSAAPSLSSAAAGEADQRHADIDAHYAFSCDAPAKLHRIETELFARFTRLSKVEMVIVRKGRQTRRTLTRRATAASF